MDELYPVEIDTPFRVDAVGQIAVTRDPAVQAVNHLGGLIDTDFGERIMRPNFGTQARRLVFENNVEGNISIITSDITRSINTWEPELGVRSVTVRQQEDQPERLNIGVDFVVSTERGEKLAYSATIEVGGEVIDVVA